MSFPTEYLSTLNRTCFNFNRILFKRPCISLRYSPDTFRSASSIYPWGWNPRIVSSATNQGDSCSQASFTQPPAAPPPPLVYDGVIFDMDGTLTVSNIDYVTMRQAVGIPVGDLFTVMESWGDGERIKSSMDFILELEAQASATLTAMPGLLNVLSYLRSMPHVRVGLVTRNTPQSVAAFFEAIGEEWRDVFDIILTREHQHVKPDKRSLLYFAESWNIPPFRLLMVGDSAEDIETGNAAGTATCMIAGGGNEVGGAALAPPQAGAVPTFTIKDLMELQSRLEARDTALGWGACGSGTLAMSDLESDDDYEALSSMRSGRMPGAPPPGLDFLDWLLMNGDLTAARCSFPRIDGSRLGIPPDTHPGDKILHIDCGSGALTKLLFSSGFQVVGASRNLGALTKRGLPGLPWPEENGNFESFAAEAMSIGGPYDAVIWRQEEDVLGWKVLPLKEIAGCLKPQGTLCLEAQVIKEDLLEEAGFKILSTQVACDPIGGGTQRRRAVAAKITL